MQTVGSFAPAASCAASKAANHLLTSAFGLLTRPTFRRGARLYARPSKTATRQTFKTVRMELELTRFGWHRDAFEPRGSGVERCDAEVEAAVSGGVQAGSDSTVAGEGVHGEAVRCRVGLFGADVETGCATTSAIVVSARMV